MPQLFNDATPDSLVYAFTEITTPPFTISAWVRTNDAAILETWGYLGDTNTANQFWSCDFDGVTGDAVENLTSQGLGTQVISSGTFTVNTWHHIALRVLSTSSCFLYNDGSEGSEGTATIDVAGTDSIGIGRREDSTPTLPFSGDIGWFALWDVVLDTQEITLLADGWAPPHFQRNNLRFYSRLAYNNQTEEIGPISATVTGTPADTTFANWPDTIKESTRGRSRHRHRLGS